MIRSMTIDNFKALNNFEIKFGPVNVLVGKNGSGKTTVLQALDFMKNLAIKDLDVYLRDRSWKASELKSQINIAKYMRFKLDLVLDGQNIIWSVVVNPLKQQDRIEFISEEIIRKEDDKVLFRFTDKGGTLYDCVSKTNVPVPSVNLASSWLKTIDLVKHKNQYPELVALKRYLVNSDTFDLLSPDRMRKSSRGEARSINSGGERIAAFIHGLSDSQKKSIDDRLKTFATQIDSLETYVKGRLGWVSMDLNEQYDKNKINIKSQHISDGTLRLIAFAAIAEMDKSDGFVLIDEIEDGINSKVASLVVENLQHLSDKTHRQIFVTTHDTVMLDYFLQDQVIYLWRDDKGNVQNRHITDSACIQKYLDDIYPGELLYNLDEEKLVHLLTIAERNDEKNTTQR